MLKDRRLLNQTEIDKFLNKNKKWNFVKDGIERSLKFNSYMDSISFINKIAVKAEELNHHPDMNIGWCNINIRFTTHDLNGLSNYDLKMAEATNKISG
tara:strand:+ start:276 stop:569 length:294 start_codon:yes stop_codon:yes gene_type:complete